MESDAAAGPKTQLPRILPQVCRELAVVRYICQACGYEGVDEHETSIDRVLCEVCGEPVMETR
jgi:hypothetical protein